MNVSLSRLPDSAANVDDQPPVFVVELSGAADRLGIDNAYDAIMRLTSHGGAQVVTNVARVQSRTAAEPMLSAARAALPGRFTVVGA